MYDLLTSSPPTNGATPAAAGPVSHEIDSASARVFARMLDVVDYGLMLLLDDGHVVFANQVARGELDERHPLQLVGQSLQARRTQDTTALRAALSAATHKGLQRLLTLGDERSETATVAVLPMSEPFAGASGGAMLVLGKRQVCEDLSADAFARHHRLTQAEVRVLKQLCTGRRPSEIAHAQGVALSTVRTQIGSVREKTGASSIGALVREVAKLPPLLNLLRAVA